MGKMKTAIEALNDTTKSGYCPPVGDQMCKRVSPEHVNCEKCCSDHFRANVDGYAEAYPQEAKNDE